jgi:hypothetical protein
MMWKSLYQEFFMRSWWVIAFMLLCSIFYEQALKNREAEFQQLTQQLLFLQKEKEKALAKQKKLEMQINSQSDLAWIEITLMKGLGVVPEGQKKIYFNPND